MHDQLQHAGNLGADGQGNTVVANLGQSTQGGMYGYYKSVDDRQNRDPTVRPFPVFVLFAIETQTFLLEFTVDHTTRYACFHVHVYCT